MQERDIVQFLIENLEYFESSSIFATGIRFCVWLIIKGLIWITDLSQNFYEKCFEFLDFTTYGPLQEFMEEMKLILFVVLTISIVLIGLNFIFRPKKKPSVVTNLLIGIFVFCSFMSIMTTINSGMLDSKDYVMNSYGGSGSAANQIVSSNLTDLLYVDSAIGLKNMEENDIPHASLADQDIKMLKYYEVIKPDSDLITTDEAKDILKKQVIHNPKTSTGVKQEYTVTDFEDIFLSLSSGYYRYHMNSFQVILSLLSLVIIFLVMGYKVVRLIWELVTSQFLAVFLSGEIFSGQGMKKLLDFVKNTYVVMFYTLISVKLYLLASEYISANFTSGVAALILFCLAFAVADGPVVVEKILGLDAGLQSGIGKLVAASHMATGAVRTTQSAYMQFKMSSGMKKIGEKLDKSKKATNENLQDMNNNDVSGEKGMPTNLDDENTDSSKSNNNQFPNTEETQTESMPNDLNSTESSDVNNPMNGTDPEEEMPTNLDDENTDSSKSNNNQFPNTEETQTESMPNDLNSTESSDVNNPMNGTDPEEEMPTNLDDENTDSSKNNNNQFPNTEETQTESMPNDLNSTESSDVNNPMNDTDSEDKGGSHDKYSNQVDKQELNGS